MKQLFKIQYGILACILLLMGACKKDIIEKPDIPKDDDRNIRILKVQYTGHDYSPDFVFDLPSPMYTRTCTYHYDKDGRLSHIKNDDILRVQVEYGHDQIELKNGVEQDRMLATYWDYSIISYQDNKIGNVIINAFSPGIILEAFVDRIRMTINRTLDGKLKSVINDSNFYSGRGWSIPLSTEISSYNINGLPDLVDGVPITDVKHPSLWGFTFQYDRAVEIPMKLKRLVNEELLFSNRYGITNYDVSYIDSSYHYSQLGEGNWLISFGLPQYYILEEKSTHLISQRTTNHYQIDSLSGNKELLKTRVEDFPYKHDAEAKTLEIAGLKIWYEFVD